MTQLANLSNTDASDIRIYYDTATNAVTRAILKISDENYFVFDGKKIDPVDTLPGKEDSESIMIDKK